MEKYRQRVSLPNENADDDDDIIFRVIRNGIYLQLAVYDFIWTERGLCQLILAACDDMREFNLIEYKLK
jgi:hypothetical protein